MALVNMTDMLQHAYRYGYAVGAFGVAGLDFLEGVIEAAEAARSPVILSLSKAFPGTENIESLALAVVNSAQRATVPVALQVEVHDDPQAVVEAIKTGCSSVIFDASQHAFPDNVALTKKAVDLAALSGVMVVGQLANLDNGEAVEPAPGRSTSPIEAKHYVKRTGVACLAVSVSRMEHGSTKHDFSRLAKINQGLGIPLGIHGGGGMSDDQFRRMISYGTAKINYSTPLFDVLAQRIRANAQSPDADYAWLVEQARDAIRMEVERCIRVWGSGGRAAEVLLHSRVWPAGPARVGDTAANLPERHTGGTVSVLAKRHA